MVQKDGGYAFQDFGKVGIPLALLVERLCCYSPQSCMVHKR